MFSSWQGIDGFGSGDREDPSTIYALEVHNCAREVQAMQHNCSHSTQVHQKLDGRRWSPRVAALSTKPAAAVAADNPANPANPAPSHAIGARVELVGFGQPPDRSRKDEDGNDLFCVCFAPEADGRWVECQAGEDCKGGQWFHFDCVRWDGGDEDADEEQEREHWCSLCTDSQRNGTVGTVVGVVAGPGQSELLLVDVDGGEGVAKVAADNLVVSTAPCPAPPAAVPTPGAAPVEAPPVAELPAPDTLSVAKLKAEIKQLNAWTPKCGKTPATRRLALSWRSPKPGRVVASTNPHRR